MVTFNVDEQSTNKKTVSRINDVSCCRNYSQGISIRNVVTAFNKP